MDTTAFPPFNLSVAAVDQLSRLGQHVRLVMDLECAGAVEATAGPPEHGDHHYGCPGLDLAVEPEVFIWLSGNTLDFHPATGEFYVSYPQPQVRPRVAVA